jgi:hypothetical protein
MAERASLTPRRELALAEQTVKHAKDVLGFLHTNPLAGTSSSRLQVRRDYAWLLRFGLAERARALARIQAATLPAHHLLWLCIHGTPSLGTPVGHEASTWYDRDSGGNGHYGGLQMHAGWGYGTSYHASDDSQLVQERAAENAYRSTGYSRAWLEGQWGQTVGPCLRYA